MFKKSSSSADSACLLKDVGVAEFNKQHLRLASYAVEFHQMVVQLSDREPTTEEWRKIDALWYRISRFMTDHFREEEAFMVQHGYPGFNKQKEQHDAFLNKTIKIQDQIKGREIKFKGKLDSMLLNWLIVHINEEDFKYREFFHNKGIKI